MRYWENLPEKGSISLKLSPGQLKKIGRDILFYVDFEGSSGRRTQIRNILNMIKSKVGYIKISWFIP